MMEEEIKYMSKSVHLSLTMVRGHYNDITRHVGFPSPW